MSRLRVRLGMSDTLQAEELRHVSVKSMTDDYQYYALQGRYKPGARKKIQGPSDEFWNKIHRLKAEIDDK